MTGTAIWQTSSNYNVVLDSSPLVLWYETMTSYRKYIAHRNSIPLTGNIYDKKLVKYKYVAFELNERTDDKETDKTLLHCNLHQQSSVTQEISLNGCYAKTYINALSVFTV